MADACPDCGTEMGYEVRTARVRTGTCGACHHAFAIVEGTETFLPPGAPAPEGAAPAPAPGGPECDECGSPLVLRATLDGGLEASCPECETRSLFVPADAAARGPPPSDRPPRGPRREDRGGRDFGRTARPCRECGGPLRFSTDDEGRVVGECGSCGNRFVLPPRRDDRRSGPPRYVPRPGGGYSPRDRSGPPPRRGGPRFERRGRRDDDEDDDRSERRRPRRRTY